MTDPLLEEFADVVAVFDQLAPVEPRPDLEDAVIDALKTAPARPADPPLSQPNVKVVLSCTFCHDALARPSAHYCASCLAPHHADCFAEHGRCAAPGCDERQVVQPRPVEAPRPRRRVRWLVAGLLCASGVAALVVNELYVSALRADREAVMEAEIAEIEAVIARERAAELEREAREREAAARSQRITELLQALLDEVDPARGRELCAELVALDPGGQAGSYALGFQAIKDGEPARAIAALSRAIELDPSWARAYRSRAYAHLEREAYAEALRDLQRAVELDPTDPDTLYWTGYTHWKLGHASRARESLVRTVMLSPRYPEAWYLQAVLAYEGRDHEEALSHCDFAIELAIDDDPAWTVDVLLLQARCFQALGRLDAALASCERARTLAGDADEHRELLERVQAFRDRLEQGE